MFPVADDFAEIAKRLKEIQAEVAKAKAAAETNRDESEEREIEQSKLYEEMYGCA